MKIKITDSPFPEEGIEIDDIFEAERYFLDPHEKVTLIKKLKGSKLQYIEQTRNHYICDLEIIESNITSENKYIKIEEYKHTGKTKGFYVINKSSGYIIGDISWYNPWREYCFTPVRDTGPLVFNNECLELITSFITVIDMRKKVGYL